MKLIGAGFGRTGTASLKAALDQIGFGPCYHMGEVFQHPEHTPLWKAAYDGELTDWAQLFDGYQSTTDWPGCTFWPELLEAYPDAKVLLNIRDADRWYDSVEKTIMFGMRAARDLVLKERAGEPTPPAPPAGPSPEMLRDVLGPVVFGTFDNRFDDREYAIEVYNQHNQKVKDSVPADRLLVYEVKQGWEPLCEFLGVDVPDEPFPHLNDSETFAQRLEEFKRQAEQTGETT